MFYCYDPHVHVINRHLNDQFIFHRGKCTVSLLNELEEIHSYIDKEDTFFYSMVYDPNQKTLLVDKGEIRVGGDYQAEIPPYIDPGW